MSPNAPTAVSHTKAAAREGATPEKLMEAIWVAAEMWAGGAYAHVEIALNTLDGVQQRAASDVHRRPSRHDEHELTPGWSPPIEGDAGSEGTTSSRGGSLTWLIAFNADGA